MIILNQANAQSVLEQELDDSITRDVSALFYIAQETYTQLISSNKELFSGEYYPQARGPLFRHILFRQFEPDFLSAKNNLRMKLKVRKVNKYHYKPLEFVTENMIFNIAKTKDKNDLPTKSQYRKQGCQANSPLDVQLRFDLDMQQQDDYYYGFITYGMGRDGIDFVNAIITNPDMNMILGKKPIDIKVHEVSQQNSEIEESITALKEGIINDAMKAK